MLEVEENFWRGKERTCGNWLETQRMSGWKTIEKCWCNGNIQKRNRSLWKSMVASRSEMIYVWNWLFQLDVPYLSLFTGGVMRMLRIFSVYIYILIYTYIYSVYTYNCNMYIYIHILAAAICSQGICKMAMSTCNATRQPHPWISQVQVYASKLGRKSRILLVESHVFFTCLQVNSYPLGNLI